MGVKACNRLACENVLCDRYSSRLGYYICDSCFRELTLLASYISIKTFMETPKADPGEHNMLVSRLDHLFTPHAEAPYD